MPEKEKKSNFIRLVRFMAIISAFIALVNFYDFFSPAVKRDTATVSGKKLVKYSSVSVNESKKDMEFKIFAQGKHNYIENVDFRVYEQIKKGDQLHLTLTPVYLEWKMVRVIRDGDSLFAFKGADNVYIFYFGLMFLLPLLAFLKLEDMHMAVVAGILISVTLLEIFPLILFVRLIMVIMGILPRL